MEQFIQLVQRMRAAQKAFFQHKHPDNLKKAIALEMKVDEIIRKELIVFDEPTDQPSLFDQI